MSSPVPTTSTHDAVEAKPTTCDSAPTDSTARVLGRHEWQRAERAHAARADHLLEAHLRRREQGQKHPVEDFIFEYYRLRPGHLRAWHPGSGVVLVDPDSTAHPRWSFYTKQVPSGSWEPGPGNPQGSGGAATPSAVMFDGPAFVAARGERVAQIRELLHATAARTAHLACFGLHEWAMVYQAADERRHPAPLRLGPDGTDAVVESLPIRCSHYDAFRFFTPAARPLNELQPTRATQSQREQPGCLHAGMDLYRYAGALLPAVNSELLLDCLEHAMRARYLDMRASPYDLTDLDLTPVRIETPAGRAEYVAAQRRLARDAAVLRGKLIGVCDQLLALVDSQTSADQASPDADQRASAARAPQPTRPTRSAGVARGGEPAPRVHAEAAQRSGQAR